MQVAGDDLGGETKQSFMELDGGRQVLQGLQVLQVPDVLTDKGVVVASQTEGVLQFSAEGQNPGHRTVEPHWIGSVATGATDGLRPHGSRNHPHAVIIA